MGTVATGGRIAPRWPKPQRGEGAGAIQCGGRNLGADAPTMPDARPHSFNVPSFREEQQPVYVPRRGAI